MMKALKKRYYVLISLALLLFIFLFFLSALVKNYINKNSLALSGRKIELQDLSINYLRMSISAEQLMVYEQNEVDTFAGFRQLYINFDPTKLLGNTYSFSSILVDSLFVNIIQDDKGFNFDDLLNSEDEVSTAPEDTLASNPFRFALHNIRFQHGYYRFFDKTVNNELSVEDFTMDLPLIAWDSESSDMGIDFELGDRGKVYIGARVDQLNKQYEVDFKLNKFSLKDVSNYVSTSINVGGIDGFVNADLIIKGSTANTNDVRVSGTTGIDSLHLWESNGTDVCRVKYAGISIDTLNLAKQVYDISKIEVQQPVVTASLYKDMSNIERILSPVLTTDSLQQNTDQIEEDTTGTQALAFRVDHFILSDGTLLFSDHTLLRPFRYDLKEINISATNIRHDKEEVPLDFSINLNDQGQLHGQSTLNVLKPNVFSIKAQIEKMRLLSFSPYAEYHIARPITQGDFNYDLSIKMSPHHLINKNHIVINELEIGDKTPNKALVKAPVKLGLYLMKDPNDDIKIDLPVEGDPSNPDFCISKLIWKALSNLLVKTAASPFNALGNLVGTRPEELEYIEMPYAQDSVAQDQRKILDKIASILEKKPELIFSFVQRTNTDTEKDKLAVLMAKKQMLAESMPRDSEQQIARYNERLLQLEDSAPELIAYINAKVTGSEGMDLNAASRQLIGEEELNDAVTKLLINRNENIHYYLTQEKGVDSTNIEVRTADLRNLPEQLRSCSYKVEVSIK